MSKILDLVENASSRKSRSEDFITRFARVYTPAVCYRRPGSGPPAAPGADGGPGPGAVRWGDWIYRALTFLVISCPCALVISIPLTFFAGIGGASKAGRAGEGLQLPGDPLPDRLWWSLTRPAPSPRGSSRWPASTTPPWTRTGCWSTPLWRRAPPPTPSARASRRPMARPLDRSRVGEIQEIAGHGVLAQVDGHSRGRRQRQAHGPDRGPGGALPPGGHRHPRGGGRPVRRPHPHRRCGEAPLRQAAIQALKAAGVREDRHAHRRPGPGGPAGGRSPGGGPGVQPAASPRTRWRRWSSCWRRSPPRRSWPSWGTASTTPPSSPGRTSASPWGPWGPTRPSRPPTWS